MEDITVKLMEPVFLRLELPDGNSARVDVCEAWRFLEDANKKPSQDQRWKTIKEFLATKLQVPIESLAESTAWQFHETVVALGTQVKEQIRKNCVSIVSSQQPIQESQATS